MIQADRVLAEPGKAPRGATSIVIEGGKISALLEGRQPGPAGARIIDLGNRFVLPGLIDSHVHLDSDAGGQAALLESLTSSPGLDALRAQWNGMKTLRAGFTTVRNLGDRSGATLALRDAVESGWVMGPRIIDAGRSISVTSGHMDGTLSLSDELKVGVSEDNLCNGVDSCREAVRRQVRRGVDVIMALRIQKERMDQSQIPDVDAFLREWGITERSIQLAQKDCVVLHPGPMNRGVEITSGIADGPHSAIQQQVRNGVAVRMAVLATIVRNVQVRNVQAGRREV